MAAFHFPKPEVVYLSRVLRYLIEIWYANSYVCWCRGLRLSDLNKETTLLYFMQIVIHLLKQVPSLNLNPEIDFWRHGRHLKNRYDVITPPWIAWLRRNLTGWSKITCRGLNIFQNPNKKTSVCLSVCLSVCHTRDLWQNGRKICPNF